MARAKSHLPEGIRTVTPMLMVKNSLQAIDWYRKAFGAEVRSVSAGPEPGSTIHAEIRIGDSAIFMADDMPMSSTKSPSLLGGASASIALYVPDSDAVYNRAVAAGAEVVMPIADMFWGDRYSMVKDPFGCFWAIATHKEDVSNEEMERRSREFFANMGKECLPTGK
ncbi:MAG: VOC family protein [Polyangia bacterium]